MENKIFYFRVLNLKKKRKVKKEFNQNRKRNKLINSRTVFLFYLSTKYFCIRWFPKSAI